MYHNVCCVVRLLREHESLANVYGNCSALPENEESIRISSVIIDADSETPEKTMTRHYRIQKLWLAA